MGGRLAIVTERMALAPVLSEAVEETRAALPDAIIRCAIEDALHGDWDADRIGQLASNLIVNAHQHGEARTPIDVAARTERSEVVISVHNEGPAIPDGVRARIFEPLMQGQVPGTPPPAFAGSIGLGLYICREIARAHGGDIDVVSAPGSGTTFTVRMPVGLKERRR
jgi:signal transduction histidine kinase